MAIGIEKILPMRAKDWCESQARKLSDYTLVGVHYSTKQRENLVAGLAKNVPDDAVIVTDYDFSTSASISTGIMGGLESYWGQATGTALIPLKPLNQ